MSLTLQSAEAISATSNNNEVGTLAVDEWTVTFGTAMRGLGGAAAHRGPSPGCNKLGMASIWENRWCYSKCPDIKTFLHLLYLLLPVLPSLACVFLFHLYYIPSPVCNKLGCWPAFGRTGH